MERIILNNKSIFAIVYKGILDPTINFYLK